MGVAVRRGERERNTPFPGGDRHEEVTRAPRDCLVPAHFVQKLQRVLHRDGLAVRAAQVRLQCVSKAAVLILVAPQSRQECFNGPAAELKLKQPAVQQSSVLPEERLGPHEQLVRPIGR